MKNTTITFLILFFFFFFSHFTFSAYLQNVPQRISQPNGQIIECLATGDEFYNWIHDDDGFTIIKNAAGFFVYADLIADELVPTNLIVGQSNPRLNGLVPELLHPQSFIDARKEAFFEEASDKHYITTPTTKIFSHEHI